MQAAPGQPAPAQPQQPRRPPAPQLPKPKDIAAGVERRREQRAKKLECFFNGVRQQLDRTDFISPFRDLSDCVDRLLPFALLNQPELSEEHLKKGEL